MSADSPPQFPSSLQQAHEDDPDANTKALPQSSGRKRSRRDSAQDDNPRARTHQFSDAPVTGELASRTEDPTNDEQASFAPESPNLTENMGYDEEKYREYYNAHRMVPCAKIHSDNEAKRPLPASLKQLDEHGIDSFKPIGIVINKNVDDWEQQTKLKFHLLPQAIQDEIREQAKTLYANAKKLQRCYKGDEKAKCVSCYLKKKDNRCTTDHDDFGKLTRFVACFECARDGEVCLMMVGPDQVVVVALGLNHRKVQSWDQEEYWRVSGGMGPQWGAMRVETGGDQLGSWDDDLRTKS